MKSYLSFPAFILIIMLLNGIPIIALDQTTREGAYIEWKDHESYEILSPSEWANAGCFSIKNNERIHPGQSIQFLGASISCYEAGMITKINIDHTCLNSEIKAMLQACDEAFMDINIMWEDSTFTKIHLKAAGQ